MSGACTLAGAAIPLVSLKEQGRLELLAVLDSVRGKKALLIDPALSGPLGLIVEVSQLKERAVERIFHLQAGGLDIDSDKIVYVVRPKVELMYHIAEQINRHVRDGKTKEYSLFFVPRRTKVCEQVLEEEGVYGHVTIGEYHLDLIPFDEDVLSLEMESAFKECYLEGDRSSLYYSARALMRLQTVFGLIPSIKGKGTMAMHLYKLMVRMRGEMGLEDQRITPEIDSLVILDREVDLVTPLMTQLTYEGLLDELFRIRNTYVDLDPEMQGGQRGAKKLKTPLNSNDPVFASVRDLNFVRVGKKLHEQAKLIDEGNKSRHENQSMSEMKTFVKRLSTLNTLSSHTNISGRIQQLVTEPTFRRRLQAEQTMCQAGEPQGEYLEECMNRQEKLAGVLRVLSIMSLCCGGLKKQWDFYRREILQAYGYEHLFTLRNMEKVGLIRKADTRNWPNIRQKLRLVNELEDEDNPKDLSFAYSGYAPLSIRLVQLANSRQGLTGVEELLRSLPGPVFEETQPVPKKMTDDSGQQGEKPGVCLVFFIGGVTFAEISALRFLSQLEDGKREYIIATTKLINGDTFIESMFEEIVAEEKKRI